MATLPPKKTLIQDDLSVRSIADFEALAHAQGVRPVQRFEDLLGNFWPEEENIDEFLKTLRRWRHEGSRPVRI